MILIFHLMNFILNQIRYSGQDLFLLKRGDWESTKTTTTTTIENNLTPAQIVKELDRHIVGQSEAKRSVAIALRNRWRRMQLDAELRQEVTPKNILMIGPTGVGKTEIAKVLA